MILAEALSAPAARLFDDRGRRLVRDLNSAAHSAVRGRFVCSQPTIDYVSIHDRISRHLNCVGVISDATFQNRAETILQTLRDDSQCADIVNAVVVPFFLPQVHQALSRDIGSDIEEIYLPAIDRSFRETFPTHDFINHHKAGLTSKLHVVPGSRHESLLQAMESEVVVGCLFISLTEFSLPAAVEQLRDLPQHILLAGGADVSAALIGSPELLLRLDGYPPLIWLAALGAEIETAGYHFEAYGYDLTFNRRVHFNQAAEYWASGLTVLSS